MKIQIMTGSSSSHVSCADSWAVWMAPAFIRSMTTLQSQAIRNIDKLPENIMSKGAKRQLIDSIYFGMVRTAQMGNQVLAAGGAELEVIGRITVADPS
jgi:hypothetical protein